MGRRIIPIKKIEDNQGRKSTFSKRCPSVYKKGYEISVLTGADFSVLTSNINGKLCYFSHPKRAEDALERFLSMPDNEKIVMDWNGQEICGRIPIGYKDSLIAQLQDLKKEGDMSRMVENIRNHIRIFGPETSADDNQLNELNNHDLLKHVNNFWSFYETDTPRSEQSLDDYKEKLEVMFSHVKQTLFQSEHMHEEVHKISMHGQQQQSEQMHEQVQEISRHGQQPNPASIHREQIQRRAYSNYMQWPQQLQQQAPNMQLQRQLQQQAPNMQQQRYLQQQAPKMEWQRHLPPQAPNMQQQQQAPNMQQQRQLQQQVPNMQRHRRWQQQQVQGGRYNTQFQQQSQGGVYNNQLHQQSHHVQQQRASLYENNNGHINPTGEQNFNPLGLMQTQATSSQVLTGPPSILSPSTSQQVSTYHTRPAHSFHQKSSGDGVNN